MTDTQPLPRQIKIEEFLPLVDKTFEVHCDPRNVHLTLIKAIPGRQRAFDDRPPFTLIFHSTPDILLVDGLYVMKSAGFGPDSIFIAPTVAAPGAAPGYYYQAVFN
ncbi:MAG: hypothetical protein E7773_13955 [Sphingomonas sp.]|uniref:DUF6916 family protein n=1 Tax=Sphingomonas sp. TaxID=28214 RepID=UPI001222D5A9|nr:hypothetical protein [Sphingomonas sp.]THD34763.1 MAG: hypothetical protein E7773_13955 [Sphingomonas sp.]